MQVAGRSAPSLLLLLIGLQVRISDAFGVPKASCAPNARSAHSCLHVSDDNTSSEGQSIDGEEEEEVPIIAKSTVKIDDGGSDLTDRFKYKMQALMGNFDPQSGEDNTEEETGNIINALTNFPARFAFTVVGRTGGDEEAKETYVEDVKRIVGDVSGGFDSLECRVTPRGANFVRVSVEVFVESTAVMNTIYDELSQMEMTVMRY
mmetsp:Transcript_11910/g.25782  ORF Transcript_11910/g.25782 Transcript_11910/m.25782 type:complete len:205 (-) Transcript_11910:48-662(-)